MQKRLAILSGPKGSGKTTVCRKLVELARQRGLDCAGILAPAHFEGARKVGIDLLDVRGGERRPLAKADNLPGELRTAAYRFDVSTIQWGTALLDAACPCDVLVIDEIGPLELERGQGWINALNVLHSGQFELAVVVVRPALLDTFHRLLHSKPQETPIKSERVFTLPIPGANPDDLPFAILSLM